MKQSNHTNVFKGYFEESIEESKEFENKRNLPVNKRDSFPVFYSGPNQGDNGPVEARLVFVGNLTTGGFKVINDETDLFKIEWQDTMWFEFNDEETTVRLNEKKQRYVKFIEKEFYEQFKEIHREIAPKENPFLGFTSSIVARPSAVVRKTAE